MRILWIGLSAQLSKEGTTLPPLDDSTPSGKLIATIENQCSRFVFKRTNLVFFAPLNKQGKLRYPTSAEMKKSIDNLNNTIKEFNPDLVFMLGNQVGKFLISEKNLQKMKDYVIDNTFIDTDILYTQVYHPSYILIYKRKFINEYIQDLAQVMDQSYKYKFQTT